MCVCVCVHVHPTENHFDLTQGSPELLPYAEELMARVKEYIDSQQVKWREKKGGRRGNKFHKNDATFACADNLSRFFLLGVRW